MRRPGGLAGSQEGLGTHTAISAPSGSCENTDSRLSDGKTVQRTRSMKLKFYQPGKARPPQRRLARWHIPDDSDLGLC